jgi:catechol 2,3-dioxygenase-like lactoylglutathione lyase family enzyme
VWEALYGNAADATTPAAAWYPDPMPTPRHAVSQAVPFFNVTDIEASLRFYVEGLGFVLVNHWSPEGRIRWCWLELDKVALMLQEYWREGRPAGAPEGPLSQGVSICLFCEDAVAIYRDLISRGIAATRPFVGNRLWVTSVADPDGYRLEFESPTDVPEETVYSG